MDDLEYDVVVYGTGLVSSLVASSLIRRLNYSSDDKSLKNNFKDDNSNENNNVESDKRKIRVLNVDKNGEYGSDYRTLTFKQLLTLENSHLLNSHDSFYDVKLSAVNQYANSNKSLEVESRNLDQSDNKIYYDLYPFWKFFDKLADHLSPEKKEEPKLKESNSDTNTTTSNKDGSSKDNLENNEWDKEQQEESKDTQQPVLEEEAKEDNKEDNSGKEVKGLEGKIKGLIESSNLFNIDLYPRLILNNSLFLKYLINSNIYKQLQLCTNNSSNVLYLFENNVNSSSYEKLEGITTTGSSTNMNSSSKDNSKEQQQQENNNTSSSNKEVAETTREKCEELMYDKSTIFRSNFLTNVEKRILFKFLFHPKSVRSFDVNNKSKKTDKKRRHSKSKTSKDSKDKGDNNEGKDVNNSLKEDPDQEQQQEEDVEEDNKENEDNEIDPNKTFVEFLKESKLNNKLMYLVNYGMCFNQKHFSDQNPSNLIDEMFKLNRYLNSFRLGNDSKGINDIKNCFVYCLYGSSNLVQFICRLNSLYQCHHMLSNTVLSVSVSNSDTKDVNGNTNTTVEENNLENNEESVLEQDNKYKTSNDNKEGNERILMKLDNYTVHTKYVVSEYDLTNVVEEFVPLENRKQYYLSEKQDCNESEKVLVVSLISNKKLFDSFNVCVVVPGRNGSSFTDTNKDNEEENPMYIIQTCRDTLTAPEGMYLLYFITLVDSDVYESPIDMSSFFNSDDDSTDTSSNSGNNSDEKLEGITTTSSSSKYSNYPELRRVLNLYEYFVNDLSNIVFLSYTTFDFNNKIQVISLDSCDKNTKFDEDDELLEEDPEEDNKENEDGNSKDKKEKKKKKKDKDSGKLEEETDGDGNEVDSENRKYLKLIDNYYNNNNILYVDNELHISDYISNQLVKMYKKDNKCKLLKYEGEESKSKKGKEEEDDNKDKEEFNFENYLKYEDEEDDEINISCDFLSDLIDKFF